jgi:fructose-specific phosphotransferase system component IIB
MTLRQFINLFKKAEKLGLRIKVEKDGTILIPVALLGKASGQQ